MAVDAIEPGPGNTFPNFPRRADGSPAWSDTPETDGIQVPGLGGKLVTPMPRGMRHEIVMTDTGRQRILIDITPRADNRVVNPPTLQPG